MQLIVGLMTIAALLLGCASSDKPLEDGTSARRRVVASASSTGTSQALLDAPAGTVGPFMEASDGGWVAVWASPDEGEPTWFSRRLGPDHRFAEVRRLMRAPSELGLVRIRLVEQGLVVLFSARREQGHSLHAMLLGPAGELSSPPSRVADSQEAIVWLDAVSTGAGILLGWAERAGDRASVKTALRRQDGSITDSNTIADGARGWQMVAAPGGAAMATVDAAGHVQLHALSATGEQLASHHVSDSAASGSIDLARTADGLVLAFETRPRLDIRVVSALADFEGRLLTQPVDATSPLGAQQLVRLVPGKVPVLVWQNLQREPGTLRAARLSKAGTTQGPVLLVPVEANLPEPTFTPSGDGLGVLLWACPDLDGCEQPRPQLVRLGSDMQPRSLSPLLIDGDEDLAWNPLCGRDECVSLVARFDTRSEVFIRGTVDSSGEGWAVPVWAESPRNPAVLSVETAFETPELSDLAATRLGSGQLLTTLTYFDPSTPYVIPDSPAPDGRFKPVRALLETRWLPADWSAQGEDTPSEVLSYRARSTAGVAVAGKPDQALIVWTAVDESEPQVFTTLVDSTGRRKAQKMQTRTRGEIHQVDAVATRNGWMVAWIDERSNRPQTYVARLSANLGRATPDNLVPLPAAADVTAIAMASAPDSVWLLQTTRSPDGVSVTRFEGNGARPADAPELLSEGGGSREAVLLRGPERTFACWVSTLGDKERVAVQELGPTGRRQGPTAFLPVDGSIGRLSGSCDGGCRVVATVFGEVSALLLAADLETGRAPTLAPVVPLTTNVAASVAPALRDDELWFHDGGEALAPSGVHHAGLRWARQAETRAQR